MARRNFLDVDENLIEKNLRFVRNEVEDNFNQYFGAGSSNVGNMPGGIQAPPRDYKVVQPKPGFCMKSYKINSNEKYFINVCQSSEIPAPEDISEEKLTEILQSESPSSFRIPMSISEPRITKDKSNNPVDACDIAINPKFFQKIEQSLLFKNFFVALIAEALSEKYNVQINVDKLIVLNNRKFIGTLVQHRVRNNDVKKVLNSYEKLSEIDKKTLQKLEQAEIGNSADKGGRGRGRGPLVQEIDGKQLEQFKQESEKLKELNSAKIKQEISQAASNLPEYKLRAIIRKEQVKEIQAEFYLPKCITINDITLDVGEDRILLESMKYGYLFDKFVNYQLEADGARAIFDKTNKMLQLRVPVLTA